MKGFLPSYSIRTLIEGIIRVALFLIYIWLISKMEDIKRVFMYHGAEHKTINCLEHGEDLTPENIKKYSRLHKRCGTSFLLIVMIVSIVVFMFIRVDSLVWKFVLRIASSCQTNKFIRNTCHNRNEKDSQHKLPY